MTDTNQKGQMGIRIYLDLASLERLIGGNTQAEIEIREGIVRTFAKKHLKELANSQAFLPQLEQISRAIVLEFEKQIPLTVTEAPSWRNNHKGTYQLSEGNALVAAFKQKLIAMAQEQLKPVYDEAYTEARQYIQARFDAAVADLKNRAEEIVAKHFDRAFEQLVKAEVERRLKEIAKSLAAPKE